MYYIMQKSEENKSIFYLNTICYQIKSFVHVYIYVNAIILQLFTLYVNFRQRHLKLK